MRNRLGVLTAVAVGVAALGIGVAAAQTGDSGPTTTVKPAQEGARVEGMDGPRHKMGHRGPGGPGGPGGKGMFGPGIHGEFTVPDGNGGYRTMASQMGTVVSVSSTSIEVKSEDGFTKKYAVSDDTMVNAGRDGIADVKEGDKVHVAAVVNDGAYNAIDIHDVTNMREWRDKFGPRKPAPSTTTTTTS